MRNELRNYARSALSAYRSLKTRTFFRFPYPIVDLYNWRPKSGGVNFGDELGRVVTSLMLARKGITLEDEAITNRQMLSIGSVMHFAKENAVVWGSGVNGKARDDVYEFEKLDVRACRGPRTRAWLLARGIYAPEVYGDPALLLPFLVNDRFDIGRTKASVSYIPNIFDDMTALSLPGTVRIIRPTQSWNRVLAEILQSSFVISSSLHGIIVAEAFGIRAQFIRVSAEENAFKYNDYYEGSGRQNFTIASSFEEASDLGGEALPDFDPEPLINAFPYDLWR